MNLRPEPHETPAGGDDVRSVTLSAEPSRLLPRPIAPDLSHELGDRYVLEEVLGRGGSGTVFRAFDVELSCHVAIKAVDLHVAGGERWLRRLAREVRLARSVRHAHVCQVYDLVRSDERCFITMELGRCSLRDELAAGGDAAAPWSARVADARAVCAGLAAAHERRITHGDLTPLNILRMPDGRLALSDFGMARTDDESTDLHGGTPSYAAPEVMLGAAPDRRSDVWQLGLVLHEVLLGRRPRWTVRPARPRAEPAGVPRRIAALLAIAASCLAWDPRERPRDAGVVLSRLERAQIRTQRRKRQ